MTNRRPQDETKIGWSRVLSLSLSLSFLSFARPASAQELPKIHYGELSTAEVSEVQAWSSLYWQRADAYIAGQSVSFSYTFTEPRMNLATFLPSRALRPTLEDLSLLSESDCDQVLVFMPGTDETILAKREALKNAMIGGSISTDFFTQPQAAAKHAERIEEVLAENPLPWGIVGSSLVSERLPLRKFKRLTSAPTVPALSFSSGTMDTITVIIGNIGNVLDDAADVTEAQAALSGGESQADAVMRVLRDDILPTNNVTVEAIDRIDMSFGIYGNVPLIYVRFTDSYVLIDGIDGTMSQVFDLTSPLDGRALLERYTDFQGDDSVRYFNKFGCVQTLAASWQPGLPSTPAYAPRPASPPGSPIPAPYTDPDPPLPFRPALPPPPAPPLPMPTFKINPSFPGWESNTDCVLIAGGCHCVKYKYYVTPTPGGGIIVERTYCKPPAAACPPASSPPGTPGVPPPGTPPCDVEYYH